MRSWFYLIWIVTIIIGSIINSFIPVEWNYDWGFIIGNLSLVFLMAAKRDR